MSTKLAKSGGRMVKRVAAETVITGSSTVAGGSSGAATGAAIGSLLGPVGAGVGFLAGLAVGTAAGAYGGHKLTDLACDDDDE